MAVTSSWDWPSPTLWVAFTAVTALGDGWVLETRFTRTHYSSLSSNPRSHLQEHLARLACALVCEAPAPNIDSRCARPDRLCRHGIGVAGGRSLGGGRCWPPVPVNT